MRGIFLFKKQLYSAAFVYISRSYSIVAAS